MEQGIEDTQFWLLVPYNILGFRANSDVSDYQVTVQIKNSRRRVAFTHNSSIRILKRDWLADTAIPVRFESDLEPGNYSASIRIRNRRMGSRSSCKGSSRSEPKLLNTECRILLPPETALALSRQI